MVVVAIAGTWLFGMAYEGRAKELGDTFTHKNRHPIIDVVRHARDYGFQSAALAVPIAFGAQPTRLVLLALSLLNALFIAQRLWAFWRA